MQASTRAEAAPRAIESGDVALPFPHSRAPRPRTRTHTAGPMRARARRTARVATAPLQRPAARRRRRRRRAPRRAPPRRPRRPPRGGRDAAALATWLLARRGSPRAGAPGGAAPLPGPPPAARDRAKFNSPRISSRTPFPRESRPRPARSPRIRRAAPMPPPKRRRPRPRAPRICMAFDGRSARRGGWRLMAPRRVPARAARARRPGAARRRYPVRLDHTRSPRDETGCTRSSALRPGEKPPHTRRGRRSGSPRRPPLFVRADLPRLK